jgi:hypothetical protein
MRHTWFLARSITTFCGTPKAWASWRRSCSVTSGPTLRMWRTFEGSVILVLWVCDSPQHKCHKIVTQSCKTKERFCPEFLHKLLPPGNPKWKNKGLRFPGVRKLGVLVLRCWSCNSWKWRRETKEHRPRERRKQSTTVRSGQSKRSSRGRGRRRRRGGEEIREDKEVLSRGEILTEPMQSR